MVIKSFIKLNLFTLSIKKFVIYSFIADYVLFLIQWVIRFYLYYSDIMNIDLTYSIGVNSLIYAMISETTN